MGCIFAYAAASARYNPSSLGHSVLQAEHASRIFQKKTVSKLPFSFEKFSTSARYDSRSSGCSIMVVYAVWDRVVRVRFPAPRQNVKILASCQDFYVFGGEKANGFAFVGKRTPERCEELVTNE